MVRIEEDVAMPGEAVASVEADRLLSGVTPDQPNPDADDIVDGGHEHGAADPLPLPVGRGDHLPQPPRVRTVRAPVTGHGGHVAGPHDHTVLDGADVDAVGE